MTLQEKNIQHEVGMKIFLKTHEETGELHSHLDFRDGDCKYEAD